MSKIFIFSSAFMARTLIHSISYLLSIQVSEILLLKENHHDYEFIDALINVTLCDSISECITNCDVIFVMKTDYIPDKTISYIKDFSDSLGKQLYVVNASEKDYCELNTFDSSISYDNIPVILNISIGKASQQFCTEILLNKIFSKAGVSFTQQFTVNTSNILHQLSKYKCLNYNIEKCIISENYDSNIFIKSIMFDDLESLLMNFERIKLYFPDIIIVNTDLKAKYQDDLKNLILYRLSCYSCFIHSNYLQKEYTKNNITFIYCHNHHSSGYCLNDTETEQILKNELLSKLSYPDEIHIIN